MVDSRVLDTIIAEAVGDGDPGMLAVAFAIANRARKSGDTPFEVISAPSQFAGYTDPGPGVMGAIADPEIRARAERLWEQASNRTVPDPLKGGIKFHSDDITPYWADEENRHGTVKIGGQVYYLGGEDGEPAQSPDVPARRPEGETAVAAIEDALGGDQGAAAMAYADPRQLVTDAMVAQQAAAPQTMDDTRDYMRETYGSATSDTDWAKFLPTVGLTQRENVTAEGLAVRPVTTVAVDPATGSLAGQPPAEGDALQAALDSLARTREQDLGTAFSPQYAEALAIPLNNRLTTAATDVPPSATIVASDALPVGINGPQQRGRPRADVPDRLTPQPGTGAAPAPINPNGSYSVALVDESVDPLTGKPTTSPITPSGQGVPVQIAQVAPNPAPFKPRPVISAEAEFGDVGKQFDVAFNGATPEPVATIAPAPAGAATAVDAVNAAAQPMVEIDHLANVGQSPLEVANMFGYADENGRTRLPKPLGQAFMEGIGSLGQQIQQYSSRPLLSALFGFNGGTGRNQVVNAMVSNNMGDPAVTNWSRETPGTLSDVSQALVEKYGSVLNSPAMRETMGYRNPHSL